MRVNNKILRVKLRNGALTVFRPEKIRNAILGAARSIGGFGDVRFPGLNDFITSLGSDEAIAEALATMVVTTLNLDPRFSVPNFPPTVEQVQDAIIHVLRSYGFIDVADVFEAWRWGKHWLRVGAITEGEFVGNGFPEEKLNRLRRWYEEHECDTLEKVNEWIRSGRIGELVRESVDAYERDLERAYERFLERREKKEEIRIFIIAGPSSSGKTTTTVKLSQKLHDYGYKIAMLNLDNYFWPINEHPTDWIADRDYETPHALDYALINRHIKELLEGRSIRMPYYDFKTGQRLEGEEFSINDDTILLLDCLHGLYPPITEGIPQEKQFRVYLENLHAIRENEDDSDPIRFTDVRLLRRMVRDSRHRNHPPLATLLHWEKVRKSELQNIIPLLKSVDVIVGGAMPFDLHALKPLVEDVFPTEEDLAAYPTLIDAHIRAERIRRLLRKVEALHDEGPDLIPGDCVIREFIGGSMLKIPHND